MGNQKNTGACSAIASSVLHEYTGNSQRLAESLEAALTACRDAPDLSQGLKLQLARTCLQNDMQDGATEVMRDVMRNAGTGSEMASAMAVLEQAGHGELATRLAQESRQHVVDLVANGAARATSGDYQGAVELMQEAAIRLPRNPAVAFNAALASLRCLEHTGWDERLGQEVPALIDKLRRLDPRNPKLPALAGLHQQILKKYDKGPRARKAG
jgi:hypothetical protein